MIASLRGRPASEKAALVVAALSLIVSLGLAISVSTGGSSATSPEGQPQDVTNWATVGIGLSFSIWPALALTGLIRRAGVLVLTACAGYLIQALAMGFSLGGPHLVSGVP